MKRAFPSILCLAIIAFCSGCGSDYYANQIVKPNTDGGKFLLKTAGTGEQMIKRGKIDQHLRIAGADGDEIDVWVIKAKATKTGTSAKGTAIMLHGMTKSKVQFPYFGAARVLSRKGYDAVLLDLRAHGRSGGKYVTYGVKEKIDVKNVVDALLAEGLISPSIYVFGENLGGSVAIQYAAIDPRCKGVVAFAPYADMRSVARRQLWAVDKDKFEEVLASAGKLAGINPDDASAVKAAVNVKVPMLLIHGLVDLTVPLRDSEAILAAAGGPKKLQIITPGPEHLALLTVMEDWVAEKVIKLATEGIATENEKTPADERTKNSP